MKAKKLLSILLSVLMLTSAFPVIGTEAESTQKLTLDASLSSTASNANTSIIPTTEQIGAAAITEGVAPFVQRAEKNLTSGAWSYASVAKPSSYANWNILIDGSAAQTENHGVSYLSACVDNDNQMVYLDGSRMFVDYILDLGDYYDLSAINVVGGHEGNLNPGSYNIYAASRYDAQKGKDNFTDNELLISYVNDSRDGLPVRTQTFRVNEGEKLVARYVCLRILNPNSETRKTWVEDYKTMPGYFLDVRLAEFRAYGTKADAEDLEQFVNLTLENNSQSISADGAIREGVSLKQYAASRTSETASWNYGVTSKNVDFLYNSTTFNADNHGLTIFNDCSKKEAYIDGTRAFADYVYDLGAYYDISKIGVLNGSTDGGLATGHYKLYASNYFEPGKAENAVSEENLLIDFYNTNNTIQQVFSISGKKCIARYVVLRVINPVPNKYANGTAIPADWFSGPWYIDVRLSQFLVYGSFVRNEVVSRDTPISGYFDFADSAPQKTDPTVQYYAANGTEITDSSADARYLHDESTAIEFTGREMGAGEYATITYDLKKTTAVKNIAVIQSLNENYRLGKYAVYASNDLNTLYTAENEVYEDDGTAFSSLRQVASFEKSGDNTLSARYVGMKVTDATLNSAETDVLRLSEFNVYSFNDGFSVTVGTLDDVDTVTSARGYDKALSPLSRANSLLSNIPSIGGSWRKGTQGESGYVVPKELTAYDGDGCSFTDVTVNNGRIFYTGDRDTNGKILSLKDEYDNYMQLDYKLPIASKITKFAIYGHRNLQWSPYHLQVSFADSRAELFSDTAKTIDYYTRGTYSIVDLEEAENAAWASVRILCGIQPSFIGRTTDESNCYTRMYHFDVFGEFGTVIDGSTVTVTSDCVDAVSKGELSGTTDTNGNYGVGAKITLIAKEQATRDGENYYAFDGWYEGDTLLSEELQFQYTIKDGDPHTVTARYKTTLSYRVDFADHAGNTVYTAYVTPGETLKASNIYAASIKVPELYGHIRLLDKNELQIWDHDVTEPINEDVTFKALYTADVSLKYTVSVTKTDNNTATDTYGFDARLALSDENAALWTVNNAEYAHGKNVTLYVFDDMTVKALATASQNAASVSIVKKAADADSLTVLAHISNPNGKTVAEAGVRFVSGTSYEKLGDNPWTDAYLLEKDCRAAKAAVKTAVNSDFMATLKNIPTTKNAVRRAAQAYVVFEDGEELYSNVMYEDFEKTLTNPIIPTASGNVADPFFAMEDGVYYQAYNKDGGLHVVWSDTLSGLATAYADGNYQVVNTNDDGDVYKNFYAPEIHKMNDGYWYIYSAPEYGNGSKHKMAAVRSKTQYLKDGFESTVTLMDYESTAQLSIDGTVMNYKGRQYFIYSEQGCMKIGLMESPTKLTGDLVSFLTPKYDWEKQIYSLVEGPAMLYHNDRVFMTFSASDSQSDYYCIGLLELTGDDPLNPDSWTRVGDQPVVQKTDSVFGPGHNSFLTLHENGHDVTYIVYHAHTQSTEIIGSAWNNRNVFIQRVYWDVNGYPRFMTPSADICRK